MHWIETTSPKVFTEQPTPPYLTIDLWHQGDDIYKCTKARTSSEAFNASDWTVATPAEEAKSEAQAASTAASEARAQAQATASHFTADEDGVHISSVEGDPNSGGNTLVAHEGLYVRDGLLPGSKFLQKEADLARQFVEADEQGLLWQKTEAEFTLGVTEAVSENGSEVIRVPLKIKASSDSGYRKNTNAVLMGQSKIGLVLGDTLSEDIEASIDSGIIVEKGDYPAPYRPGIMIKKPGGSALSVWQRLDDWPTETGTDGVWTYKKYADGTYSAWAFADLTTTAAQGTLYGVAPLYWKRYNGIPLPSFNADNEYSLNITPGGSGRMFFVVGLDRDTNPLYAFPLLGYTGPTPNTPLKGNLEINGRWQ